MLKSLKRIFFIILGTFIMAISVGQFLLPGDILTGGVAGLTVLIKPFVDIDTSLLNSIITVGLNIVGFLFLGKEFLLSTIIYSITYPSFLMLIDTYLPMQSVQPLLASLYGGIIGGLGLGLIFRQGGASGGMDVPPMILNKYFKMSVSRTIMFFDAVTVLLGLWIYDLEAVLIGLVSVFCTNFAMEMVLEFYGGKEAKKIEIISDHYQTIIEEIHKIDRGTTLLSARGGYTNANKQVIMCIATNEECNQILEIVDKYDKEAFIILSEVKDVHGEGFTYEARL